MSWESVFAEIVGRANAGQAAGTLTRESLAAFIAEASALLSTEAPGSEHLIEVLVNMRDAEGDPLPPYGDAPLNRGQVMTDDEFFALLEQLGKANASGTLEEPAFLEMYRRALAYPDFRRFAEPFLMTAEARGWDVSSVDPEGAKMLRGEDSSGELPEDDEELDPELVDEPVVKTKKLEDAPDPEEEVQIDPPKLQPHDIDVPEEPETVRVITRVFDRASGRMVEKDLGEMLLVPTGCEAPTRVSPYDTTVTLRSALPRDKQLDANLYAAYQTNGWASRRWIQQRLDEDIDPDEVDKEIADGLPLLLELQGKGAPAAGVGQTNGPGDNNGAPLPPGPGPGRGNLNEPGDNMGGM